MHNQPTPDSQKITTMPLKVIFAGTPEFAGINLQQLVNNQEKLNIEIVAVYSQPDRKSGRGQKITASEVKQVAVANNLPIEQPVTFKKSTDEGVLAREKLASYQADLMIVVAYGLILPIGILQAPRLGCINVHGSLLPRWRGAAPIHRAILAGDTSTGITVMQMDKGLDTGDILYKVECPILPTDTTANLHDKLADLGAEAIQTVLSDLSKYQAQAEKQDDDLANYAEKLEKNEGNINWNQSAVTISRHIRGMFPYPSAFTFIDVDGKKNRVKVIEACSSNEKSVSNTDVGTVIDLNKEFIAVACADGSVLNIVKLQFAGGKGLTAEQVYTGNKLKLADKFIYEA